MGHPNPENLDSEPLHRSSILPRYTHQQFGNKKAGQRIKAPAETTKSHKGEIHAKSNGIARAHRDDRGRVHGGFSGRGQNTTRAGASEARLRVPSRSRTKRRRGHHRSLRTCCGLAEAFDFAARPRELDVGGRGGHLRGKSEPGVHRAARRIAGLEAACEHANSRLRPEPFVSDGRGAVPQCVARPGGQPAGRRRSGRSARGRG